MHSIQALLHSVPLGKLIVLDLYAEVKPIWATSKQFYGTPYIWKVTLLFCLLCIWCSLQCHQVLDSHSTIVSMLFAQFIWPISVEISLKLVFLAGHIINIFMEWLGRVLIRIWVFLIRLLNIYILDWCSESSYLDIFLYASWMS